MPGTLAPIGHQTVFDINGDPVPGAKIYTYLAGTTTPVATFTNYALTTPNTNPIIADSAGRFVAYLTPGQLYKFLYKTAADVTLYTDDNLPATPGASGVVDTTGVAGEPITAGQAVYLSNGSAGLVAGKWYLADADNTYSSTLPVVGICIATVAAGSTGTFRTRGQVTGLTGLTIGATYYISTTAGGITTVAPGNVRPMGQADSATSLVLDPLGSNTFTATITATAGIMLGGGPVQEVLNDYRSGGWNPTCIGSTGGAANIASQYGFYVKIGRLVWLTFQVVLNSAGTMTGGVQIGALPFQPVVGMPIWGTLVWASTAVAFVSMACNTQSSGPVMDLYGVKVAATSLTPLVPTDITGNTILRGTVVVCV